MNPSTVRVKRCLSANLLLTDIIGGKNPKPALKAVEEFLVLGLKYSFVPERGELTRGVPTCYSADRRLYELLVLVDAIRGGKARERDIAVSELQKRLGGQW